MAESDVNLAALIGSRICHDLISPIGAISNGLELLDMSGAIDGPEMALIADSVGNAGARLRFFRIAYGAAGQQVLGGEDIAGLLRDLGRDARVRADWAAPGPVPRAEARLAFLALQCCETAMPAGGVVRFERDGARWRVTGRADRLKIDPPLWQGLSTGMRPLDATPAQVQFALLPVVAANMGRRVAVTAATTTVSISF